VIRYLKITLVDGTRFILRVTGETPRIVRGYEVDAEGEEVAPAGYERRLRVVGRDSIRSAVAMRMNPTYAVLERVPTAKARVKRGSRGMAESAVQLDAEIAEVLSKSRRRSGSRRQRMSALRPVEGLRIPAESRRELIRFWRAHPVLRSGCLRKYGFDPIDDEAAYWRLGLAEPSHRDVLRAVRRNDDVFALALVKRWEVEELADVSDAR
jgi:hypothetical protein